MNNQSNSRVFGAFLIGFAIVSGAYMANTLNRSIVSTTENVSNVIDAPLRVAIPVKDSNEDGIEDWREEFVKTAPIITTISDEDYVTPDTLTGQASLAFMQRIISAKSRGDLESSQMDILNDTVSSLTSENEDKIYSIRDIIISEDVLDNAIYNYGNAAASAIIENNVVGLRNELLIVRDILNSTTPKEEDIEELKLRAQVFRNTRDSTLNIPVPKIFVKEHLDLINTYNALHKDISSMISVGNDPLRTLIRLKRYDEDTSGLLLALGNMYTALDSQDIVTFKESDPAVFFVLFSPNFNKP